MWTKSPDLLAGDQRSESTRCQQHARFREMPSSTTWRCGEPMPAAPSSASRDGIRSTGIRRHPQKRPSISDPEAVCPHLLTSGFPARSYVLAPKWPPPAGCSYAPIVLNHVSSKVACDPPSLRRGCPSPIGRYYQRLPARRPPYHSSFLWTQFVSSITSAGRHREDGGTGHVGRCIRGAEHHDFGQLTRIRQRAYL